MDSRWSIVCVLGATVNFVPIPKNASMAVREVMPVVDDHKRASEIEGPRWALVRNPFDRMASAYAFARTHYSPPAKACLAGAQSFAEFLRLPDNTLTRSQLYWLDAPVDLLLRFEDLPGALERHFGNELPVINESHGSVEYDDETRALVIARYAKDFERFGYVAAL